MRTWYACAAIVCALTLAAPAWAQAPGPKNAITDVPGVEVGHFTSPQGTTGTTVIVTRGGATAGVTQRGGAPGTRETDLLKPEKPLDKIHAVSLSGGSAYGLAAADGVMQCLEAQGIGFEVEPGQRVPIVPAAILFDPGRCAAFNHRPDASFGLAACQAANNGPVAMGTIGAGTGARSGGGVKGGLGTASATLPQNPNVMVGAIVAVNSVGRTFDTAGNFFAGFLELSSEFHPPLAIAEDIDDTLLQNTTIAVVATNAVLNKAQITKIAQMADDGFARAIKPSHAVGDGDTIFALSTGTLAGNFNNQVSNIGALAADVLSRAIVHAILNAKGIPDCGPRGYCEQFPDRCVPVE